MIDLECSQGNVKKFKNETDHCSIQLQELSKKYSSLIEPPDEQNKQRNPISGLRRERDGGEVQETEFRTVSQTSTENQENQANCRAKCLRATYSEERRLVQIDLNNQRLSDRNSNERHLEDSSLRRYKSLLARTSSEVDERSEKPRSNEFAKFSENTDMQCASGTNDSEPLSQSPANERREPNVLSALAETANQLKAITCSNVPSTSAGPKQPDKQEPSTSALRPSTSRYQEPSPQSHHPSTSQAGHCSENHNVHFANKNEKSPSISVGHFSIYLDRLDYEYRPSDALTGKLHLLLEAGQIGLRRIVVYLKGISSVK